MYWLTMANSMQNNFNYVQACTVVTHLPVYALLNFLILLKMNWLNDSSALYKMVCASQQHVH